MTFPHQTGPTVINLGARRHARQPISLLDRLRRREPVNPPEDVDLPGYGIHASEIDYPHADPAGYEQHIDHPAVLQWREPGPPKHRARRCWCGETATTDEINTADGTANRQVCTKHGTPGIFGVIDGGGDVA